jgi:tRNA nucleotidyltransferase (CCA-adding enzyme)
MKEYLNKLPKKILDLIYLARESAARNNLPIYLAGGFVRDLTLGVKNFDLDIVVEGDGINFAEGFAERLKAKLIRHPRFGTATVILSDQLKIDVASARKEFYPEPAHLPVVENSTLKDDQFRRDFSINAMAISIAKENFGVLIDFFGGAGDLKKKKIRILHNLSFIDDPTRILRAIRFEQRYDFKIESSTLKLLKQAVRLKMLEKIQPQRIRDELILMLKEERPIKEIKRIKDLVGFKFINKRLLISKRTLNLLASIERQIYWFKKVNSFRRPLDTWLIYFMGLTGSLSINDLRLICRKFGFRKGEEKRITTYKKINHEFILALSKEDILPSKIFNSFEPLSYEVILLVKAKYKNKNLRRQIKAFFQIYNDMRIFISGRDLNNLGILPGPYYQKILSKVMTAKLNGLVRTKEEELALIRKLERI